jgi:basic membrane protein A
MTSTGVVGTYGGGNIPPVVAFMDGFARGVAHYNKTHGTKVVVIGWDVSSQQGLFINEWAPGKAAESMTIDLMGKGADIIYPVAGQAGQSTLMIMKNKGTGMVIGVDSDWSQTYPDFADFVLSSVVKRMDSFTFEAILMEMQGTFKGGTWEGTLANGGVGITFGPALQGKIPDTLKQEIEALKADIINGKVLVK